MVWDYKNCVLKCKDIHGTLTVFEISNYNKHKSRHRELEDKSFCPTRIIKALKTPTLTIKGNLEHTLCYYLAEFEINGITKYTKVVVFEKSRTAKVNPTCYIMTAFRIDHIQELQYKNKPTYY